MGAGLAGLACAHELERLGVLPVIFEKKLWPGKEDLIVESMAQLFHHHPGQDLWIYLREELGLPVHPHGVVNKMVLRSATEEATVTGHLAYTTLRGPDRRSLERQLADRLAAAIRYGEEPDPWQLREAYDWVVIATGDHQWTKAFSRFTQHIEWTVRSAEVSGLFNPAEQQFFFNTRYAKTGYAMLSPIDERRALAGLGIPHSSPAEAEQYWERFRREESRFWEAEIHPFRVTRWEVGVVDRCVVGNVMLIGQAGGFCEPLGMLGQCPSLASGVMAARQIALGDRSLERYTRQFRAYYNRLWRLRRNVNAWTDTEMDMMVRAVRYGGPLAVRSPLNLLGPGSLVVDLLRMADDPSPEAGPQ